MRFSRYESNVCIPLFDDSFSLSVFSDFYSDSFGVSKVLLSAILKLRDVFEHNPLPQIQLFYFAPGICGLSILYGLLNLASHIYP